MLTLSALALWVFCVPTAALVGPVLGASFLWVWSVWITYRMLMAGAMFWSWRRRDWIRDPHRTDDKGVLPEPAP